MYYVDDDVKVESVPHVSAFPGFLKCTYQITWRGYFAQGYSVRLKKGGGLGRRRHCLILRAVTWRSVISDVSVQLD